VGVFIVTVIGAVLVALLGLWSARIAKQEGDAAKRQALAPEREKEVIQNASRENGANGANNQPSKGAWEALVSGKGQPISHR
jgi:hypothetical protein